MFSKMVASKSWVLLLLLLCGIIPYSIAGRNINQGHWILEVSTSTLGQPCVIPPGSYDAKKETGWPHKNPHVGSCTEKNNEMCGLLKEIPKTTDKDARHGIDTSGQSQSSAVNKQGRGGRGHLMRNYFSQNSQDIQYDDGASTTEVSASNSSNETDSPFSSTSTEPDTTEPEITTIEVTEMTVTTPPPGPTEGVCRCGYLNEAEDKKILLLEADSKGICRGILGYPCKTYFLGKNVEGQEGFHQSCLSGKCDLELDMCVESLKKGNSDNHGTRVSEASFIAGGIVLIFLVKFIF